MHKNLTIIKLCSGLVASRKNYSLRFRVFLRTSTSSIPKVFFWYEFSKASWAFVLLFCTGGVVLRHLLHLKRSSNGAGIVVGLKPKLPKRMKYRGIMGRNVVVMSCINILGALMRPFKRRMNFFGNILWIWRNIRSTYQILVSIARDVNSIKLYLERVSS